MIFLIYIVTRGVWKKDLEIIKSFDMMSKVVNDLNLNTIVKENDLKNSNSIYALDFGIEKFSVPKKYYNKEFQILAKGSQYYLSYKNNIYLIKLNVENSITLSGGDIVNIVFNPKYKDISKYTIYQSSEAHAVKKLKKYITIQKNGSYSDLIEISAVTNNPRLSIDVVNSLSQEAMNFSSKVQQRKLSHMIDFLC